MFIVEGNIGSGKSTFLKLIQQKYPFLSVNFEQVQDWQQEIDGQSILKNFYQDTNRWAYSMELQTMLARVKTHIKEQNNTNIFRIFERSIYSGHYCFAHNDYLNNFLTKLEWEIYLNWFNFLIPNKCKAPTGFIYLKVDPEISYKRIVKRNRNAETSISIKYLEDIYSRHEEFLINKKNILPELVNIPVLVLDCNYEFETDIDLFNNYSEKLLDFIINTTPKNISEELHPLHPRGVERII